MKESRSISIFWLFLIYIYIYSLVEQKKVKEITYRDMEAVMFQGILQVNFIYFIILVWIIPPPLPMYFLTTKIYNR